MDTYEIYIAGEFITTAFPVEIVNPFTGTVFSKTFLGSAQEANYAVAKAKTVESELSQMSSFKKHSILLQIAGKLDAAKQKIAGLITRESGKPIKLALAEVDRAVFTFQTAAEETKRLPKEYIDLDWASGGENREGLIKYFPVGLIAGFTPFNFPLNLVAHKVAPAFAAGCPIIIKPSPKAPLTALELARIIEKTDLPKGAFSVIPMMNENAHLLLEDHRIKMISFTGSSQTGWLIRQKAGKKKVVLELGGNAGVIVSTDCNLDHAVSKCVNGSFSYSGQTCIHTQRIFVQKDFFDLFLDKFLSGVKKLKMGDPENPDTDISVLIDKASAERIDAWVKEVSAGGARILFGGGKAGCFYEPTVITHTHPRMKVCSQEVFAPVVVIEPYSTFSNAVDLVNDSEFGLQAGIFTNNQKDINFAFNNLEVGGVIVNDVPNFRMDHMPYGGVKDSGMGREGVRYAMLEMLEPRLLVKEK